MCKSLAWGKWDKGLEPGEIGEGVAQGDSMRVWHEEIR